MKLSIFCLVYNHGKYLKKALDGFLMQKTNFDFEIVVGEDCSTDNSRSILLEYQKKYSTKFKLLLHNENIGMAENVISTLEACKGEYVALCEGDDYWTDPDKLQKQVDFLDHNPDFSICYHRVEVLDETIGFPMPETLNKKKTEFEFDINFLATGNKMNTQSVVFRNRNLNLRANRLFRKAPASDFYLHMLNAQYGKIKYLPEMMAVYRVNSENSVWSSLDNFNRKLKLVILLKLLREEFANNMEVFSVLNETCLFELEKLLHLANEENADNVETVFIELFHDDLFRRAFVKNHIKKQIASEKNLIKRTEKNIWMFRKTISKRIKRIMLLASKAIHD